jgi:hypothetical protein
MRVFPPPHGSVCATLLSPGFPVVVPVMAIQVVKPSCDVFVKSLYKHFYTSVCCFYPCGTAPVCVDLVGGSWWQIWPVSPTMTSATPVQWGKARLFLTQYYRGLLCDHSQPCPSYWWLHVAFTDEKSVSKLLWKPPIFPYVTSTLNPERKQAFGCVRYIQ